MLKRTKILTKDFLVCECKSVRISMTAWMSYMCFQKLFIDLEEVFHTVWDGPYPYHHTYKKRIEPKAHFWGLKWSIKFKVKLSAPDRQGWEGNRFDFGPNHITSKDSKSCTWYVRCATKIVLVAGNDLADIRHNSLQCTVRTLRNQRVGCL